MRTKQVFATFFIALLILTTGCSITPSDSISNRTYLDDGSYYYSANGHTTYNLKTLPFDLEVESNTVPLQDVSFFETYENHGYTAYVVVTLNRKNLTDDDIHWITSYDNKKLGKTLHINVYSDSEKNALETESLEFLGCVYNDSSMHYSFRSDSQRYSFLDSRFSCQIIVAPSGITENDAVYYHYDLAVDIEVYSDTIWSLSESERGALKQSGYTEPSEAKDTESDTTPLSTAPPATTPPATSAPTEKPTEKPTEPPTEKPTEKPTDPPAPTTSGATTGENNALRSAKNYLSIMAFSYQRLIEQLEYEGYSNSEAKYAADNCNADWNAQAVKSAKKYLTVSAFSHSGLIQQLEYEGFTSPQATYGADHCGADWYEQAEKSAENYLSIMPFSRDGLISQLEYEGFTHEQAAHGADSVGL